MTTVKCCGGTNPFGFVTDEEMTGNDWRRVLKHFGRLSAYSVFKPKSWQKWATPGYDVAVRAAQALEAVKKPQSIKRWGEENRVK